MAACLTALAAGQAGSTAELRSVRAFSGPEASRIVLELSRETRWKYGRLSNPERLFVDLLETRPKLGPGRLHKFPIGDARVQQARAALKDPRTTRVVLDLNGDVDFEFSHLTNPERLVIEVRAKGARRPAETLTQGEPRAAPAAAGGTAAREQRTASGPPAFAAGAGKTPSEAPGAPPESPQAESSPDKTGPAQISKAAKPAETGSREAGVRAMAQVASPRPEPEPRKKAAAQPEASTNKNEAAQGAKRAAAAEAGSREPGAGARAETSSPQPEPVQMAKAAAPAEAAPRETRAAARAEPAAASREAAAGARKAASESAPAAAAPLPAQPARPTRKGDRSLTRALGLHIGRIVLDPGHGGHDQGTRGPTGLLEKDLVLDVALRLGALLEERLGADVVYTRQTDEFIPLEERTAIANEHRADLFLSIHANSSPVRRVSGAEVFYLNFTTSKEALELAARENAGHGRSIFELRELIQKIALKDKLDESREFAGFMQQELSREWARMNPAARNRGVKTAPFVVLIGASMPSVLAEIGFLSNPRDEALLKKPLYRQRLAESLFRGIERYARSLGQTQALRAATEVEAVQSTR